MASIRLGNGAEARGSIGGVTYSRNRAGAYIRNRVTPVNPSSPRQVEVRTIVTNLAVGWQSLSSVEQGSWNQYAEAVNWKNRLGETIKLSGNAMYVRVNSARVLAGLDPIDQYGGDYSIGDKPIIGACIADESAQTLSVAFDNTEAWATAVGGALSVAMALPQSPGRSFCKGPYRIAGVVLGAAMAPTSPVVFNPAPWIITAGQRIWCRFRALYTDGRVSEFTETNFLAVA